MLPRTPLRPRLYISQSSLVHLQRPHKTSHEDILKPEQLPLHSLSVANPVTPGKWVPSSPISQMKTRRLREAE